MQAKLADPAVPPEMWARAVNYLLCRPTFRPWLGDRDSSVRTDLGYIWIPNGFNAHASGTAGPWSLDIDPPGIAHITPFSQDFADQGITFNAHKNTGFNNPIRVKNDHGDTIGQFIRVTFENRIGAGTSNGTYTYDFTYHGLTELYPGLNPTNIPTPCHHFTEETANSFAISVGVVFPPDQVAEYIAGVRSRAEQVGGIAVQFVPGYDC